MTRRAWLMILGAAVVVAVALSPLASSLPDGLDAVAVRLGFAGHAAPVVKPLAGYSAVTGVAGALVVFVVAGLAAWLLRRRSSEPAAPRES